MIKRVIRNYRALLATEPKILNKARIRLLTILLLTFIFQRLCLLLFLFHEVHEQFILRTVLFLGVLVAGFAFLFIFGYWKAVAHFFLISISFLIWSSIIFFDQGLNLVVLQYTLIIISCGYYILGSRWGLVYSLANLLPIIFLLLFSAYTGFNVSYNDHKLNVNIFNFLLVYNFLLLLFTHYYFFNAFKKTNRREQKLKANLKKLLKDAEEIASAKTNFLSKMSHELRTPLNAVVGMANILLMDEVKNSKKENLEVLLFSANNLMFIINEILDFDKLDSGKIILNKQPFRFDALLKNIEAAFRPQAEAKKIIFDMVSDTSINNLEIVEDHNRLSQIFFNLVDNAIKFTPDGSVLLKAEARSLTKKQLKILFTIKDTGIGISSIQQKDIFNPYLQKNSSTDRQHYGTGLGLTIANKLLHLHDSNLELLSTEGEGTTLSFELNFEVLNETSSVPDDSQGKHLSDLTKLKVLVAEDNAVNILVLNKMLNRWNIFPKIVGNGKEALEAVLLADYDVILMDINMPVMDGFEASRKIRQLQDEKKSLIHIIAVTASIGGAIESHPGYKYVDDCVLKPFPPHLLKEKLDKLNLLKH